MTQTTYQKLMGKHAAFGAVLNTIESEGLKHILHDCLRLDKGDQFSELVLQNFLHHLSGKEKYINLGGYNGIYNTGYLSRAVYFKKVICAEDEYNNAIINSIPALMSRLDLFPKDKEIVILADILTTAWKKRGDAPTSRKFKFLFLFAKVNNDVTIPLFSTPVNTSGLSETQKGKITNFINDLCNEKIKVKCFISGTSVLESSFLTSLNLPFITHSQDFYNSRHNDDDHLRYFNYGNRCLCTNNVELNSLQINSLYYDLNLSENFFSILRIDFDVRYDRALGSRGRPSDLHVYILNFLLYLFICRVYKGRSIEVTSLFPSTYVPLQRFQAAFCDKPGFWSEGRLVLPDDQELTRYINLIARPDRRNNNLNLLIA